MLSQSELLGLFEYRDGAIYWRQSLRHGDAGKRAGTVNGAGYRQVCIRKKIYPEHRVIYMMHHGYVPALLDHINAIRDDNRIENLRPCTQQQNTYNSSGWGKKRAPKGVTWHANDRKWQAQISIGGKNTYIGQFKTIKEAEAAVVAARKKYHGKFARNGKST